MGMKRTLDRFDLEAESEGRALRGAFRSTGILGKKIAKSRSVLSSVQRSHENAIATKYLIKPGRG